MLSSMPLGLGNLGAPIPRIRSLNFTPVMRSAILRVFRSKLPIWAPV